MRVRTVVALAMVVAWATGAALSRRVGFWTGLGSTALVLGALALVLDRGLRSELRPSLRIVGFGAAAGGLLAVGTWTLYPVLASLVPGVTGEKIGLYAEFSTLPRLTAAILLPLIVVAEELVWRGLVSNWLWPTRSVGRAIRIAVVATIYGMATLPSGSPLLAFAAFACGLVWSWLREVTRSVLASASCHFVWAVLILFVHPVRLG